MGLWLQLNPVARLQKRGNVRCRHVKAAEIESRYHVSFYQVILTVEFIFWAPIFTIINFFVPRGLFFIPQTKRKWELGQVGPKR